jgi:hypothetical protein
MRISNFVPLLENSNGLCILYRGDASRIEQFSTEKTRNSIGLLFGLGIYLTDNQAVAKDYTIKGGWKHSGDGTAILRDEAETKELAVRAYINMIIVDELKWHDRRQEISAKMAQKWHTICAEHPDERGNPMNQWNPEYKELYALHTDEYQKEIKAELRKYLENARKIYRKRASDLRVYQTTMGTWQILTKEHSGVISEFHIPESYCRKTFHGDRPLNDHELSVVRDFILAHGGHGYRDLDEKGISFDEWLVVFRKTGTRYAWREQIIGGKGINPTLDEVWNGTHGGTSTFYNHPDDFIASARAAGYVGIEYNGGVRVAGNVRGGGGLNHRAFVFWDDDYINSCRVESSDVEYTDDGNIDFRRLNMKTMMKGY